MGERPSRGEPRKAEGSGQSDQTAIEAEVNIPDTDVKIEEVREENRALAPEEGIERTITIFTIPITKI